MPQVTGHWEDIVGNHLVAEQQDYDSNAKLKKASLNIAKLNAGQRHVHDKILNSALAKNGGQFFVNGPGGMGKSFTWNTLGHSGRGINLSPLCGFIWHWSLDSYWRKDLSHHVQDANSDL